MKRSNIGVTLLFLNLLIVPMKSYLCRNQFGLLKRQYMQPRIIRACLGHSKCNVLADTTGKVSFQSATKPDFMKQMSSKYFDYALLEKSTYDWWETSGYFKPHVDANAETKKCFTVPMPPPNVTGYLHMGHAIFIALQDIVIRFQRMRGKPTLWLPGT